MFDNIKELAVKYLGLSVVSQLASDGPPAMGSRTLSITAITGENNISTLQCWQIQSPFAASTQKGITGASVLPLAFNSNTSLVSIPPKFDGGLHVAPALQYVVFLSGIAEITTPEVADSEGAWIHGGHGSNSIIFAADTAEVSALGHSTRYPSTEETFAIPLKVSQIPEHVVLHDGPCGWQKKPEPPVGAVIGESLRDEL